MTTYKITQEELKAILNYNPETGVFVWRVNRRYNLLTGKIAGCLSAYGYIGIRIYSIRHYAHRLAWLYVNGTWPTKGLDHINRIKTDNRIANLREATDAENAQNTGVFARNKTGCKGVHFDKSRKKYMAFISKDKRFINLGRFDDYDSAVKVRKIAEKQYHPFIVD
jgi:hypothetical protein